MPTRSRPVRLVVAAAALAFWLTPTAATAARHLTSASLVVDDAHILTTAQVVDSINRLDPANSPATAIAVVTTNDPAVRKATYDADLLAHLQAGHVDAVLNDDESAIKPGLVLVAISPDVRQVGVYGGAGTNLTRNDVQAAVDAMRTPARNSDWDGAAVAGAAKALQVTQPGVTSTPSQPAADPLTFFVPKSVLIGVPISLGALVLLVSAARVGWRRRKALAWPGPGAKAVDAALARWQSATTTVRSLGYPQSRPPVGQQGQVDPSAAIRELQQVSASGPSRQQRLDETSKERLLALVAAGPDLTEWEASARFWAREPGWKDRWAEEFEREVTRPLAELQASLGRVSEYLPSGALRDLRSGLRALAEVGKDLDRRVRKGVDIRPDAGVLEARVLNQRIAKFARIKAKEMNQSLSSDARQTLRSSYGSRPSGGLESFAFPYLLASLATSDYSSGSSRSSYSSPSYSSPSPSVSYSSTDSGAAGGSGGF